MKPKNRITAALLAFFTGFVGMHKLYLGSFGGFIGFCFLFMLSLKMSFPLSLFIGVMQGLKLIRMSDLEFDKKYNRGYIPTRRGPLEARREEQMRRYDQTPDGRANRDAFSPKPSPTVTMKANPFKNSGIKKYKDFDLEEAIIDFKKGLEISPNDVALHFNIACAYSLTEKKELAYLHLNKAVLGGLKDVEKILSHDDLAYVRIQPEFQNFRANGFRVNPFVVTKIKDDVPKEQPITDHESPQDLVMDDSLLAQLNKLAELRKRGILSEDEFIFERRKILKQ